MCSSSRVRQNVVVLLEVVDDSGCALSDHVDVVVEVVDGMSSRCSEEDDDDEDS